MANKEAIQQIVEQWARERPDLDTSGFEVVGRILVLSDHLRRRVGDALAPLGLGLWGFDVLATLRRQGPPFRLTPTELSQATMLTSGAMTNRLDRLEEAGLVRRDRNPDDRRGVLVVLTGAGHELVDRAVAIRFQEAAAAVAPLTAQERETTAALLGKLLASLELESSERPAPRGREAP